MLFVLLGTMLVDYLALHDISKDYVSSTLINDFQLTASTPLPDRVATCGGVASIGYHVWDAAVDCRGFVVFAFQALPEAHWYIRALCSCMSWIFSCESEPGISMRLKIFDFASRIDPD